MLGGITLVDTHEEILDALNMHSDETMEDLLNSIDLDDEVKFDLDVFDGIANSDRRIAALKATQYPCISYAAPNIVRDPILQHMALNSEGVIVIALEHELFIFEEGKPHLLFASSVTTYFTSVSWCPGNDHIFAVGKSDGTVTLYDYKQWATIRTIKAHVGRLTTMSWRDGNCLATGGADGRIVHFDSRLNQTLQESSHHKGEICCLQWNPESTLLASGGTDKSILIFDAAGSGRLVAGFVERQAPVVQALSWSSGGLLAIGGGHKGHHVKFVDTRTSSTSGSIDTGSPITDLAWNQDCIVSSHTSSKICSWSYASRSLVKEYAGHSAGIMQMGIAGSFVFAAGADEIVNLWQL